jgi:glycosyltransferase involved in cell wall biosynthesis
MRLTPHEQWKKFRIVRCGIFANEFPHRTTTKAREILCVGRLCPSKGQAILVEAAKMLADRGKDFHLRLLGGGEDLDTIRALVERSSLDEYVTVEGAVGHARVKEALAACDLFVLPSFAEGIPVALMEAMAAGIPVVSTNIMGIPELIEHENSGILTQPSHAAQLADALEAFIEGRRDIARLTEAALATVRADYDAERNTRELGALFRAFLGIDR